MKKSPLILLCFLALGPAPPDEELKLVRASGIVLSDVSLLRLEGDTLVTAFRGDTLFVPVQEITEISSRSLVMGFTGCWFGLGVGAVVGASCAAASGPYENPSGGEIPPGASMGFGAAMGGLIGMFAGCAIFPENEQRYILGDQPVEAKKAIIKSILTLHATRHR